MMKVNDDEIFAPIITASIWSVPE